MNTQHLTIARDGRSSSGAGNSAYDDPPQPSEQESTDHEMTRLLFQACEGIASRAEDERKTATKRQRNDVSPKRIWTTCAWETRRKGKRWLRKALALLVAREKEAKAVFSTDVLRTSTGEWICSRLMARLREIGLEFVDIVVKPDTKPALTSLRVMEQLASVEGRFTDDCREQSSGQLQEPRDR